MMLQPESLHLQGLAWLSHITSPQAVSKTASRRESQVNSMTVDTLMKQLVPADISPNKRAIAERLITLWLEQARA